MAVINIVTCRRVAKRQLCERSDCETVSTSYNIYEQKELT
jgi:hypothetical protein